MLNPFSLDCFEIAIAGEADSASLNCSGYQIGGYIIINNTKLFYIWGPQNAMARHIG